MNNALTVSRRGFGLGAAAFGLLLVSGCSRGSSSDLTLDTLVPWGL